MMDIMERLLDGPKGPTRLAQACNLSYDVLMRYIRELVQRRFVDAEDYDGHEVVIITQSGVDLYREYRTITQAIYPNDGPEERAQDLLRVDRPTPRVDPVAPPGYPHLIKRRTPNPDRDAHRNARDGYRG